MAMQSGIGFSKILVIAGVGYTTTILFKNGKLSDLIGELQSLIKGLEKPGDQSSADTDYSDAIAAQVRRLAAEVKHLASARQITVLNNSGQMGNASSLIIPATALGALGYGYMWWKGLSFSNLMYVTKKNMENAVAGLTKHLEHVNDILSEAKRQLTQRVDRLNIKMEDQKKLSEQIKENVGQACLNINKIDGDLSALQDMVSGLDGKIMSLEYKQDLANMGVLYLCNFVDGKKMNMPEAMQELKISGKTQHLLASAGTPSLKGLKEIADSLSGSINGSATDPIMADDIQNLDNQPRPLLRATSARC